MTQQSRQQQTVYPAYQQTGQIQVRPTAIQTCVSRKPQWLTKPSNHLVVLVRDASGSMRGKKAREASKASGALVRELGHPMNKDGFYVAVVDFDTDARIKHPVTKATALIDQLRSIFIGGSTNIRHGLELTLELVRTQSDDRQNDWHPPVVVLYSDGEATEGGDPVPVAEQLHREGAVVITIAYGKDADMATLEAIASSKDHCYRSSADGYELRRFMAHVGRTLTMTMATGGHAAQTLGRL